MLQYGKIIVYNNKLYFGNNSSVPTLLQPEIDLSQYATISQLNEKTSIITAQRTGTGSNANPVINLGFTPKCVLYYSIDGYFHIITPQKTFRITIKASSQWNSSNYMMSSLNSSITTNGFKLPDERYGDEIDSTYYYVAWS